MTAVPADTATITRWEAGLRNNIGDRPNGMSVFNLEWATWHLGAPFFDADQADGSPRFEMTPTCLLGGDVFQLNPSDAGYTAKLQAVLDNIKLQVGGDWRIETRTTEVYSLQEGQV